MSRSAKLRLWVGWASAWLGVGLERLGFVSHLGLAGYQLGSASRSRAWGWLWVGWAGSASSPTRAWLGVSLARRTALGLGVGSGLAGRPRRLDYIGLHRLGFVAHSGLAGR